jgi:hypothetical protein
LSEDEIKNGVVILPFPHTYCHRVKPHLQFEMKLNLNPQGTIAPSIDDSMTATE